MIRFVPQNSWFNRDIVECKVKNDDGIIGYALWFNRDIVECKDYFEAVHWCHACGFNRDIVECKDRALNIAVTSRKGRVSRNPAIRFAAWFLLRSCELKGVNNMSGLIIVLLLWYCVYRLNKKDYEKKYNKKLKLSHGNAFFE